MKGSARQPAPSALLGRCCLVENPAKLALLGFIERRSTWSLGLQQRSEENAVIPLGAGSADGALMHLLADPLALKDLGFPFATEMAQHRSSI